MCMLQSLWHTAAAARRMLEPAQSQSAGTKLTTSYKQHQNIFNFEAQLQFACDLLLSFFENPALDTLQLPWLLVDIWLFTC